MGYGLALWRLPFTWTLVYNTVTKGIPTCRFFLIDHVSLPFLDTETAQAASHETACAVIPA